MVIRIITPLLIFFSSVQAIAQGVHGFILDEEGEGIPFATIFIRQTGSGTTTNMEGFYELKLPPGAYDLVYQHLGYTTQVKQVGVGAGFTKYDVVLQQESIVLRTVEIKAGNEDPAYTIMRKAIAKSKFHQQQLDSYQARVYVKGSGRLIDAPFFLRKTLAKEGVDSTFTFVSESISEINYTRPNTFVEKVVSVRTSGEDNDSSPNAYIFGSFYEADIGGSVSPLSPKAFGYYRFEYLGTVRDRKYEVSKIRVTPRSKGDDVFTGILNIVEDYWSIHSLDLETERLGIKVKIKQIYNPIEQKAWLPVSHRFEVTGKILGFKFEYNYLATVSNYDIELNPDLDIELEVIDENVERDLAAQLEQKNKQAASAQQKLADGKAVTRKELRKLINAYEKDELGKADDPRVIENHQYSVDSLAANPDSLYWASIRPVPLSSQEVMGYHKMDSMAVVRREEADGDTLKTGKRKGFHIQDVVLGNSYKVGTKAYLRYYSPLAQLNFNTVEGYNFSVRFRYSKTFANKQRFRFIPTFRYGFSSGKLYGKARVYWSYGTSLRRGTLSFEGGRYVRQINNQNPIHPLVNTITTLLLQSNYMKLYESSYLKLSGTGKLMDNLGYSVYVEWSERVNLDNTTTHTWIDNNKEYTSNNPENAELADTSFPTHRSLIARLGLRYQPWLRYRIRYGSKRAIKSSSPAFSIDYKKGINTTFGATDFDLLEVGFKHNFSIGVRGRLGIDLSAGTFLNNRTAYFMDFKHFDGNESPFLLDDPVGSYRLLSYYKYSTLDQYVSALAHYQFRKFLITQIPILRLTGVKELAFISYLGTPYSENYMEVGYGIDNLFRILRVEAAASFQNGNYRGFGVKIGIATSVTSDSDAFNFGI
jgi:ribosomal protein L19